MTNSSSRSRRYIGGAVLGLLLFGCSGCAMTRAQRRAMIVGGVASAAVGTVLLVHTVEDMREGDDSEEFVGNLMALMGESTLISLGLTTVLVAALAPKRQSAAVQVDGGLAPRERLPATLTCPPGHVLARTMTPGVYECIALGR